MYLKNTALLRDDPAVILLVVLLYPFAERAGIHQWIFSHRQGNKVTIAYALAVVLAAVLSIPYWQWLELIH